MIANLLNPNKLYNYLLILRNPNKEALGILPYTDFSFTNKFNDYNEISFTLNKLLYSQQIKENYKLPAWDKLKAGQIIEMQVNDGLYLDSQTVYKEYFSLQQPAWSDSDLGNQSISFSCVAAHQDWFNRLRIRGYSDTRQLFNCELSEDGVPTEIVYTDYNDGGRKTTYLINKINCGGVLNYLLDYVLNEGFTRNNTGKYPSDASVWKVVYYDPQLKKVAVSDSSFTDAQARTRLEEVSDIWLDNIAPQLSVIYNLAINGLAEVYLATTHEDGSLIKAYTQDWFEKMDSYTWFFRGGEIGGDKKYRKLEDIIQEPLLGAYLLSDLEQLLIETQSYLQDILSFKYITDAQTVSGPVAQFTTAINIICINLLKGKDSSSATVDDILSLLAEYYKNATGSVPYRALNLNCNVTEAFKQISEAYNCIFSFDNIKKEISIFSRENEAINKTTPLLLSAENYITSISLQEDTDQVVTRLYPKGKDGLQIGGYSVPGVNYVDNYDYFFSDANKDIYVSNDGNGNYPLIDAVRQYEQLLVDIQEYQDEYDAGTSDGSHDSDYLITVEEWVVNIQGSQSVHYTTETNQYTIKSLQKHIVELSNIEAAVRPMAKSYLHLQDSILYPNGSGVYSYKDGRIEITTEAREAANSEILRIVEEAKSYLPGTINLFAQSIYNIDRDKYIEGTTSSAPGNTFYISNNIARCQDALVNWQKGYQYKNITSLFTNDLIAQLQPFIKVDEVDFSDITDGRTLYKYAQMYLTYKNEIPVSISLDLVALFNSFEHQPDWLNMMQLGTFLYIDFPAFNLENKKLRFISYTHSVSESGPSLTANFSNTYELQNAYNQIINDIWAYSYKQIKDINLYRDSWQQFIDKQQALLLQGQQIYSDVNGIINKKGNPVITSAGLKISPAKHNMLQSTGSGYYVKRPVVRGNNNTMPVSGQLQPVSIENVDPETIKFNGATTSYNPDTNTLEIATGGEGGLPWDYAVPMLSEKNRVLLYGDNTWHVAGTGDRAGNTYVYYQEMKNGTYTWYEQQIDLTEANKVQAYDENGHGLYWTDASHRTVCYNGEEAVYLYASIGNPQIVFQAYRNTNAGSEHLPIFKFGIGDGSGHGYGYLEKTEDGMKVYYYTRTGAGKDTTNRNRGIFITDTGLYQIRGSSISDSPIPFIHYNITNQDSIDIEEGDWVLVRG